MIREARENKTYHKTNMHKELILMKLREQGGRITEQRKLIIDTILENECTSCKEIYYKVSSIDPSIGLATVYRMVNTLEEIGAISRKNMYRIIYPEKCVMQNACKVMLDDGSSFELSVKAWSAVVRAGLAACGYLKGQEVASVIMNECDCKDKCC